MENTINWYTAWAATRLHAVEGQITEEQRTTYAICGTLVYRVPPRSWSQKRLDAGIPRCKRCENYLDSYDKEEIRNGELTNKEA